jgi:hypothetical protein
MTNGLTTSDKYTDVLNWAGGPNPTPDVNTSKIIYYCKDPDWVKVNADRCDKRPGV